VGDKGSRDNASAATSWAMSAVQLRTREDAPDRIRSLGTAGAMLSMSRRVVGGGEMKADGDVQPKS
jgi:hypothetical protein